LKISIFCILLLAFFEDQRFFGVLLLGGLPYRLVVGGEDIGEKEKRIFETQVTARQASALLQIETRVQRFF
jgi:hypothetical protein